MVEPKPGPTRTFEKVGYKLSILIPARWNEQAFAGICLALGCPREFAWIVAAELGRDKERKITVRTIVDREILVSACKVLGVYVEDIPPL